MANILPILLTFALFPAYHYYQESLYSSAFAEFTLQHNREYASDEEFTLRYEAFKTNVDFINARNKQDLGYTLAVNKFADMTDEELNTNFPSFDMETALEGLEQEPSQGFSVLPNAVDWTEYSAVTGIKDTVTCHVSAVFAAIAAIESNAFIAGLKLNSFSEQMIIDCIPSVDCTSNPIGYIEDIINFFNKTEPMVTYEAAYPYVAQKQDCMDSGLPVPYQPGGFKTATPNSEQAMVQALLGGPIVVSMVAEKDFIFYNTGIFNPPTCDPGDIVNHSVLLVGYLETNFGQETSWKVKNSWGLDWGEMGYMRVGRVPGSTDEGVCKIQSFPFYPVKGS